MFDVCNQGFQKFQGCIIALLEKYKGKLSVQELRSVLVSEGHLPPIVSGKDNDYFLSALKQMQKDEEILIEGNLLCDQTTLKLIV